MKITSFNPLIVSQHSEEIIQLFEALGFERRHMKTDIEGGENTVVRMRDPSGFHVDVASSNHVPQDLTSIRINVDDFDEAYEFLTARGFKNAQGDKVTDTGSSHATMMVSPSGFAINLIKHIRKEEQ